MLMLEQECSRLAWDKLINNFGENPEHWQDTNASEYLGALKKTPARIHTCGLGQALAFLRRGERPAQQAQTDISNLTLLLLGIGTNVTLLDMLRQNDTDFWFLATDETMRVITWLARYLEGEGVKSKHGEEDDTDEQNEVD